MRSESASSSATRPTTNTSSRSASARSFSGRTLTSATARTSWSRRSPTSRRFTRRPSWGSCSDTRSCAWSRCCWWCGGFSFAGDFSWQTAAIVTQGRGWRRGNALPLQYSVWNFFLFRRALLFLEDVAARQLETGLPPALWPLRREIQAGIDQPARALDPRGERRRSQRVHPAHPRVGTARPEHQDRGIDDHLDRHGRIAAEAARTHREDLLSRGLPEMRAPRLEPDPSRGGAPGGGGNLAQFHLAAGRQKHPLVSGECPAVRSFLPRLQTIRFSLSSLVCLVHRRGRAKRGGRGALARTRLPAGGDSGGRQSEVRCRPAGGTSSAGRA